MGRSVPCSTALPNHTRRAERAARAKETVNKSIPDILRGSPRARHGIHQAERIVDPPASDMPVNMEREPGQTHIKIRLLCTDTLSAAQRLSEKPFAARVSAPSQRKQHQPNVAVLNFASPLRPGGGFLDGANSQEEFICARSTLYPGLWDKFYRLPEIGGIYAQDVMVFRDSLPEANDLAKRDRYFVDVISAGMIRFPDMNSRMYEEPDCTCGISYCNRDRELVINKMKAVLRIAEKRGNKKLILGAWGCGAYGNPVLEVAKLWRKVIAGAPLQRKPNAEAWTGIEEIVFAIPDRSMIPKFEKCFEDILTKEPLPSISEPAPVKDQATEELLAKIVGIEMQLDSVKNRRTKARLEEVLAALNKELSQSLANKAAQDEDLTLQEDEEVEDFVLTNGFPSSELDDNLFIFDENDIASSSSDGENAVEYVFGQSGKKEECPSPKFDHETGWFNGSVDELTRMLKLKTGSKLSEDSSRGSLREVADDFNEITIRSYLKKYGGSDALSPGHSVA